MGYNERKWGIKKSVKTRLLVHICEGDACDMGFTRSKNLAMAPFQSNQYHSPCLVRIIPVWCNRGQVLYGTVQVVGVFKVKNQNFKWKLAQNLALGYFTELASCVVRN